MGREHAVGRFRKTGPTPNRKEKTQRSSYYLTNIIMLFIVIMSLFVEKKHFCLFHIQIVTCLVLSNEVYLCLNKRPYREKNAINNHINRLRNVNIIVLFILTRKPAACICYLYFISYPEALAYPSNGPQRRLCIYMSPVILACYSKIKFVNV